MPKAKRRPNVLALDPSRTASLRRAFARDVARRYALLRSAVVRLVADEDAFGLAARPESPFAANRRWAFRTSDEQLAEFEAWLAQEVGNGLEGADARALYAAYAERGFRRGAGRAFDDVRAAGRAGGRESPDFYRGSREEFLRSSFGRPVATERIKALAGRVFTDMKGVNRAMQAAMQRTLADGLVQGKSPREVARDLARSVESIGRARAELVARSELIRAHAEGQLFAFGELGVGKLVLRAEWLTTDDGRQCIRCKDRAGTLHDVKTAHGMIPLHPLCRCTWAPHFEAPKAQAAAKAPEKAAGGPGKPKAKAAGPKAPAGPKAHAPAPPALKPGSIPARFHAGASEGFRRETVEALNAIPDNVHRAMAAEGVAVEAHALTTDALPHLKGVTPRGWPAGMTWDSAEGTFDAAGLRVISSEFVERAGSRLATSRAGGVLLHEYGHGVDWALGRASASAEFAAAYEADAAALAAAGRQARYAYYLQAGSAGREEAFAEVFAQLHGAGASGIPAPEFLAAWPNVARVLKSKLEALP